MPHIQDILKNSSLWEKYTLQDESVGDLDSLGRILLKNKNSIEPVVSKYLFENGFRIEFPNDKKFAICLTHDIDKAYTSVMRKGINLLRGHLNGRGVLDSLKDFSSPHMPNCNFKKIMDIENKFNARSTFFLLALRAGEKDYNYNVESLKNYTGEIIDRGFEIGLHGGFNAYKNRNSLHEEKIRLEKALNKKIVGFRNHYLLFDKSITWRILTEEEFSYDSTLGYPDGVGYRSGLCYPFYPYDVEKDVAHDIIEFPIVVMDRSLEQYNELKPQDAWSTIKPAIDASEEYGGVITLNWHNIFMWGDWGKLYEKILNYGVERQAYLTNCIDLAKIVHGQI